MLTVGAVGHTQQRHAARGSFGTRVRDISNIRAQIFNEKRVSARKLENSHMQVHWIASGCLLRPAAAVGHAQQRNAVRGSF